MEAGDIFEQLLRASWSFGEGVTGYRPGMCFIAGALSQSKSEGDDIGFARLQVGDNILVRIDAHWLPAKVDADTANRAEPIESAPRDE